MSETRYDWLVDGQPAQARYTGLGDVTGSIEVSMEFKPAGTAKELEESQKGAVVVCLVPCATDTKWWHNYAMKAQEIRFIKGRVRFVGYDEDGNQVKNSPTFSSCVVIFWQRESEQLERNDPPRIGKTIEQPKKGGVPV
jgi:site-specific DNA-methyltransferase (adenine-specific)